MWLVGLYMVCVSLGMVTFFAVLATTLGPEAVGPEWLRQVFSVGFLGVAALGAAIMVWAWWKDR